MSNAITSLCWTLRMAPTQKAVLIALADHANDLGECWPSIPTICERTCFSRRAVIAAIAGLESSGILTADRSNGRHTTYYVKPQSFAQPMHLPHGCTSSTGASEVPTSASPALDQCTSRTEPVQQMHPNRKEPSKNRKSNRQDARDAIALPDWLPEETWRDWADYRKAGKNPMTARAVELSIADLEQLRVQGHDPVQVIHNAIKRGWRGLYAPPQLASVSTSKPSVATNFRGKEYAGTSVDDLPDHLRPTGTGG